MLERLEIHNYALIEDSAIEFGDGFSVITGETGAGKSIILGALSLLLGERTEVQSIRNGCESASVSASFYLQPPFGTNLSRYMEEQGLELDDGSLLINRVIKTNGRSTITIQGRSATRNDLSSITKELMDISAQRDHQSLLAPANQLAVLDAYGLCGDARNEYQKIYSDVATLKSERARLVKQIEDATREADYLRFAVEEITNINPLEGEDDQLTEQIRLISSFEQIHEALSMCTSLLNGNEAGSSVLGNLHQALGQLGIARKSDPALAELETRLESTYIECEDIYESLRDRLHEMKFSEEELDRMQGRLAQLQRLKKKYGRSLEAVMQFHEDSKQKLDAGEHGEILLSKLDKQLRLKQDELIQRAQILTANRKDAAIKLQSLVEEKLRTLGMAQAVFEIGFSSLQPSFSGCDEVTFQICANPGLEMRSIREVASGGELSRIMLAVKTSLSEHDSIPTLIFDEVDAGIGGSVALSVAGQLKQLSQSHQVIVITHLASIASKADTHLVVSKEVREGMSYSLIREVKTTERQKEIARMLSGDDRSEESLGHAKKLLDGVTQHELF